MAVLQRNLQEAVDNKTVCEKSLEEVRIRRPHQHMIT